MIPFVVYYVISFVFDKLSEERFSEDALLEKVVYYLNYLTCYRMYLAEFRKKRLGGGGGGVIEEMGGHTIKRTAWDRKK